MPVKRLPIFIGFIVLLVLSVIFSYRCTDPPEVKKTFHAIEITDEGQKGVLIWEEKE